MIWTIIIIAVVVVIAIVVKHNKSAKQLNQQPSNAISQNRNIYEEITGYGKLEKPYMLTYGNDDKSCIKPLFDTNYCCPIKTTNAFHIAITNDCRGYFCNLPPKVI